MIDVLESAVLPTEGSMLNLRKFDWYVNVMGKPIDNTSGTVVKCMNISGSQIFYEFILSAMETFDNCKGFQFRILGILWFWALEDGFL